VLWNLIPYEKKIAPRSRNINNIYDGWLYLFSTHWMPFNSGSIIDCELERNHFFFFSFWYELISLKTKFRFSGFFPLYISADEMIWISCVYKFPPSGVHLLFFELCFRKLVEQCNCSNNNIVFGKGDLFAEMRRNSLFSYSVIHKKALGKRRWKCQRGNKQVNIHVKYYGFTNGSVLLKWFQLRISKNSI